MAFLNMAWFDVFPLHGLLRCMLFLICVIDELLMEGISKCRLIWVVFGVRRKIKSCLTLRQEKIKLMKDRLIEDEWSGTVEVFRRRAKP